jgi:ATP-binding cassette subfamily C (CFTR/MRP) protein 1
MSFDTVPLLLAPQASSDQTNVDLFLPFFVWLSVSMYITVLSVLIVTCQVAWPSVIAIIPLVILNLWYRVSILTTLANEPGAYMLFCLRHLKVV